MLAVDEELADLVFRVASFAVVGRCDLVRAKWQLIVLAVALGDVLGLAEVLESVAMVALVRVEADFGTPGFDDGEAESKPSDLFDSQLLWFL